MYHPWLIFATLVANAPPATPPPPPTYISDRLSVALHGANAPDAPIVKQVLGGAPIKILSREGALLKIRTEDGSVGWVERELVTNDTPIHLQYLDLTDRFSKAQETIKALQDKSATSASASSPTRDESKIVTELRTEIKNTLDHAVELEKHIRNNSTQVIEANKRVRALEEENTTLNDQLAAKSGIAPAAREPGNFFPAGTTPVTPKYSISLPWFLVSLSLVLALGSGVSWFIMKRRLRKKFSMFRAKL